MLFLRLILRIDKTGSEILFLFEETKLGRLVLRNRFVRSATGEKLATDKGLCTPMLIETIRELARGGVGLIIPGHAYVDKEGRSDPRQLGVHSDLTISGLTTMARAAHEEGAAIILQLTYAGSKAEAIPCRVPKSVENMTHEDIAKLVQHFGNAAERAQKAGFDGVQIHIGHGYGLCQFVSPFLNPRKDEYGGVLENRLRIVLEILREVRSKVGKDYTVITKMNSEDFIDGGTTPEMMIAAAELMEKEGLDAIEISGGIGHPKARYGGARNYDPKDETEEAYYKEAAKALKQKLNLPLILVGGIRRLSTAAKLIEEGTADFISLSRPLLREPDLINRWLRGDDKRAACVSCNACAKTEPGTSGLRCVFREHNTK